MSFRHSETEGRAETGADREAAGGLATHGPRPVHGRHPQCRPGDGKPQPGLLAPRVQVHDDPPTPISYGVHSTCKAEAAMISPQSSRD